MQKAEAHSSNKNRCCCSLLSSGMNLAYHLYADLRATILPKTSHMPKTDMNRYYAWLRVDNLLLRCWWFNLLALLPYCTSLLLLILLACSSSCCCLHLIRYQLDLVVCSWVN